MRVVLRHRREEGRREQAEAHDACRDDEEETHHGVKHDEFARVVAGAQADALEALGDEEQPDAEEEGDHAARGAARARAERAVAGWPRGQGEGEGLAAGTGGDGSRVKAAS